MCNITVSLAEKRSNSIFVQGTSDCRDVFVQLQILGSTPLTVPVDNNGNWEATFTSNEVPTLNSVPCPDTIKIEIHCVEDPNCKGPADIKLMCEGATCPSVIVRSTNISSCDDNGQRTATFDIDIGNAPDPTILEINYGDGTDENINNSEIVANAGSTITKQHPYNSGSYTVVVNTIFPEGCQSSNPVNVDVPPCDLSCPDDVDFEVIDANGNRFRVLDNVSGPYQQINDNPGGDQIDCLPDGDYTVRLVEPSGTLQSITWREDDNPPMTTNQPDFNVHLNSGDQKAINVTVIKQNCAPLSESVVVKACGCEETDWSEWSECENCIQTRTRTLSDCSQETETRQCTITPTNFSPWAPTGFCSQTRSRLNENCQTEVQSRIDWCCIWMWVTIGLIGLTAVSILVTLCMLPATFWSAVAALGSGGTLSAVWAALTTIQIVMIAVSIALLAVSLIVLILWLIFCVFMNTRNAACFLLSIFIGVMAWLTSISAVLAVLLSIIAALCAANIVCLFQALGCAIGAWIDVAWFGIILSVAIIIQSFLCRRGG